MTPHTITFPPNHKVVALALDDRMVYGFIVLAHSLVRTAAHPVALLVGFFSGRLSTRNQQIMKDHLQWLGIEHEIRELTPNELFSERRHLTITTFSKFVLSDQYPGAHLWLDLDTVALAGWDSIYEKIESAPKKIALVVAEKLASEHTRFDGFNAGVLGWTKHARKEWTAELANLPEKRFSSEQYLFNALYADNVSRVDVSYNFLSSWHEQLAPGASPRIIHYSGPIKPWHLARRHRKIWRSINRSWEFWFQAEDALRADTIGKTLHRTHGLLAREALFSGRLHTGKGAMASWVMRILAIAGPLGVPLVALIRSRSKS